MHPTEGRIYWRTNQRPVVEDDILLATPPASKMFETDDRDLLIEEPKFKVGDVVLLKSGGPEMTIIAIIPDEPVHANLAYFSGYSLITESLPIAALRKQ